MLPPSGGTLGSEASGGGGAMTHRSSAIAILFLIISLGGCAGIHGRLPAPLPAVGGGRFLAGAARVDITPMPGYPMGGYAVAGYVSRGVWMRLHARAFCFEDADGKSLAMVSADLWAIPAGLGDRVAELVARRHGIRQLAREQIVLVATHTHNGPGNFSSSKLYNRMASPQAGFDGDLFEFLASRMASAIAEAWKGRRPVDLVYAEAPLPGVVQNRDLEPFLADGEDARALLEQNGALPIRRTPFPMGGDDRFRAVDPTLRLIRVQTRGLDPSTLGVLAFFATHPTVMNTDTEVYNSDIFGVAASLVESSLAAAGKESIHPVVAIFNGPEGDVLANWTRRDRTDAIEVGSMLANGITRLVGAPGENVTGAIAFNFGWTSLRELAMPLNGASTLCGAQADWSFFRDAGFYEGMTQPDVTRQVKGQGPKRLPIEDEIESKTLKSAYPWIAAEYLDPPQRVPLGAYRIGPVVIGTLPGEFTTILGSRIRKAMAGAAPSATHVLLVGPANEYLSYFTTAEEYEFQHYDGASMIYGPRAGKRVTDELAALTAQLGKTELREKAIEYGYSTGSGKRFGVEQFDLLGNTERLKANHYTLAGVLMDRETGVPVTDHPRFIWIDESPKWSDDPDRQEPVMPSVAVEARDGTGWAPLELGGRPENDQGLNFVTTIVASWRGSTRWTTIWMTPSALADDPALNRSEFRFVVQGTSGTYRSPAFTLESARSRSGLTGIAREPERPGTSR